MVSGRHACNVNAGFSEAGVAFLVPLVSGKDGFNEPESTSQDFLFWYYTWWSRNKSVPSHEKVLEEMNRTWKWTFLVSTPLGFEEHTSRWTLSQDANDHQHDTSNFKRKRIPSWTSTFHDSILSGVSSQAILLWGLEHLVHSRQWLGLSLPKGSFPTTSGNVSPVPASIPDSILISTIVPPTNQVETVQKSKVPQGGTSSGCRSCSCVWRGSLQTWGWEDPGDAGEGAFQTEMDVSQEKYIWNYWEAWGYNLSTPKQRNRGKYISIGVFHSLCPYKNTKWDNPGTPFEVSSWLGEDWQGRIEDDELDRREVGVEWERWRCDTGQVLQLFPTCIENTFKEAILRNEGHTNIFRTTIVQVWTAIVWRSTSKRLLGYFRDFLISERLFHSPTIATLSISTHQVKTKIWGRGDKLNFGHQQFWRPCYESTCVFPIWRWGISSWRHPFCWFSGKRPFWRNVNSYSADLLWWWTSVRSSMMKWWWILEGRDKFWVLPPTCNNL